MNSSVRFSFTRNTFKEDKKTFYNGVLSVLSVGLLTWWLFGAGLGVIGIILTTLSLSEIFFPFRYVFGEKELLVDRFFYKIKKDYTYYKAVYKDKNGIFISPYRIDTVMEKFRGVLLRIPASERETVYNYLKEKIENEQQNEN